MGCYMCKNCDMYNKYNKLYLSNVCNKNVSCKCEQIEKAIDEERKTIDYYAPQIVAIGNNIVSLSASVGDNTTPQENDVQAVITAYMTQLQNMIAAQQQATVVLQTMLATYAACADN